MNFKYSELMKFEFSVYVLNVRNVRC